MTRELVSGIFQGIAVVSFLVLAVLWVLPRLGEGSNPDIRTLSCWFYPVVAVLILAVLGAVLVEPAR